MNAKEGGVAMKTVLLIGVLALVGCSGDQAPSKSHRPTVAKVADTCEPLSDRQVGKVQAKADAMTRQAERQEKAKTWLIAGAVVSGLFALAAGLGKFLGSVPSWWGAILGWIAGQVRVRSIVVAGVTCAGCIALAIWLPVVWDYVVAAGWIAVAAFALFATWELSCRFYTGKWAPDGLVRLPAGWRVAKV